MACGLDEPGFDPLQWGWMVCIDAAGTLLWDRNYTIQEIPGEFGGFFGDIKESNDGKILVLGNIHDKYPLESAVARDNAWLVKTELNGCIETHEYEDYTFLTSVDKEDLEHVKLSVYPNPSNDQINIVMSIEDQYRIDVFDISGMNVWNTIGYGGIFFNSVERFCLRCLHC